MLRCMPPAAVLRGCCLEADLAWRCRLTLSPRACSGVMAAAHLLYPRAGLLGLVPEVKRVKAAPGQYGAEPQGVLGRQRGRTVHSAPCPPTVQAGTTS